MAFNITNFIGSMGSDGARPNLFTISIGMVGNLERFRFRAKASSIPGSRVGVAPAFYFGRQAKFAGNRVFDDWTVTVLVDEGDFGAGPRYHLELWAALLNSHNGNIRTTNYVSPASYMTDGTVVQYAKNGVALATYDMIGCFPIDISPIGLDWGANDTIEEFTVTFAMQYWASTASKVVDNPVPSNPGTSA